MVSELPRKRTAALVVIYCVGVSLIAWLAPLLGGSPASPGPGFVLWGVAPLAVSVLLRAFTRDWSDLGVRPVFGRNAVWYLVSVLLFPLVMILSLVVGLLSSMSSLSDPSIGKLMLTALRALPFFTLLGLFEEVGWRGYLWPKLASLGLNSYISAIIVALVWGSWHLPYIRELAWVYSSEKLVSFIPRFYLLCFALSLVMGSLRSITLTFWPAVLFHAVGNSFGHPLAAEHVSVRVGSEFLGSASNGLVLIVLMVAAGVLMNRWQLRKPTKRTE